MIGKGGSKMKWLYLVSMCIGCVLTNPALAGDQISNDCADAIARNGIDPWNQLPVPCGSDGDRNVGGLIQPGKPTNYETAQRAHESFQAMNAAKYFRPACCRR